MIDTEERLAELRAAYDTLVAFNLWRRGKIEAKEAAAPQEIGDAIDVAAGVLWEVINDEKDPSEKLSLAAALERGDRQCMRANDAEQKLKSCEAANEYLKKELDKAEHEIKLAKKEIVDICTRHNIRYYMDEQNRLWEIQDKTYAERVHAAQEDADADPSL